MKKFEFIEHTADIGVRIYGDTLEDLFCNAAAALFSLLRDAKPTLNISKDIKLDDETYEDLLVNWLNELIAQVFADRFLAGQYMLSISHDGRLKRLEAKLKGEGNIDFEKINMEVKAATYHNLKITQSERGYVAEVIFDV